MISRWLKSERLLLTVLLLAALLVRLYRVDNPVLDWHAFRQADTASVTREYVKHGIDLLRPHYHDLSNIQSGQPNLEGWRMVEFPLINGLLALLLRALPNWPLVFISRLFSIIASLGSLSFLYFLVKKLTKSRKMAWLSGFFFAFLPYSIYYSRVILPEPFMLLFSLGSLYFFATALTLKKPFTNWRWWASAVLLSLAILLKPFVVFLFPVFAVLFWQAWKTGHWSIRFSDWGWWLIYLLIALLPFGWWRTWIEQFPSGIPASDWLFNGNGIRFTPAWVRWIFYERLTKLILGFGGVILAGVAMFFSKNRLKTILWAWALSLLAYVMVLATGNVQHDYYQVIFIPLVSICLGVGTWQTWQWFNAFFAKKNIQLKLARLSLIILIFLNFYLTWQQIKGFFNVNHWEYQKAGRAVDRLVPTDAKLIAPAFGDTQFLFQTNRTGWPIGFEIQNKIDQGATHYVTTSLDDEARELAETYAIIEKNDLFLLLDLTKPQP
ncbi:MAG: hypothetical protein A2383_00190 [Candidatus Pacebacteria bacterium RIFOXYB1_FULL_39_46]|nr:MAG: hypothetical protein A2383_00190 [Candidatus Pacebacteria bacterium RIFOXYB1_FULL_39_46]OGJ38841.1 MAG: hypothetical protein A2182_02590 [Candidatus Pacebacteria bacterium RIFOXYA1_FULL_38_18]OGJ40664.1 MAG: hypothetical protein A2582_03110 [Candidatus Pacebacteria bacterium RIFOXYD1_FULL_39_27]OGJ40834.1 MAG: hypothetical protein A2411_00920 [Candidatus Pacebacteria bacterium RIFOXYC1_FULL_39_21]